MDKIKTILKGDLLAFSLLKQKLPPQQFEDLFQNHPEAEFYSQILNDINTHKNNLTKVEYEVFSSLSANDDNFYKGNFEKLLSLNSEWLRYFLVLVESKSYITASNILKITPQALSKSISGIESVIGCRIIERDRNYRFLTFAGEIFLEKVKNIIYGFKEIENNLNSLYINERKGTLRIACMDFLIHNLLSRTIVEFSKNYPDIFVSLEYVNISDIEAAVENGEIDLAFLPYEPVSKNFEFDYFNLKKVIVGVPQHKKNWRDLDYISYCPPWLETDIDRPHWLNEVNISITSGSVFLTLELCEKGFGAYYTTEILVKEKIKQGKLAIIAELPVDEVQAQYFFCKTSAYKNQVLLNFSKQLKKDLNMEGANG